MPFHSFSTLVHQSRLHSTHSLISLLSFSPVNICDWAFWTGLISHLRALIGKNKVIGGWTVWPSDLKTVQVQRNNVEHTCCNISAGDSFTASYNVWDFTHDVWMWPRIFNEIWYWIEPVTAFWNVKCLSSTEPLFRALSLYNNFSLIDSLFKQTTWIDNPPQWRYSMRRERKNSYAHLQPQPPWCRCCSPLCLKPGLSSALLSTSQWRNIS